MASKKRATAGQRHDRKWNRSTFDGRVSPQVWRDLRHERLVQRLSQEARPGDEQEGARAVEPEAPHQGTEQ